MNLNILKGLLILTVIFDHNDFSRGVFADFLRGMSFHVVGFLAIPFLRDALNPVSRRAAQYVFRLYFPFLLMTLAMGAALMVLGGQPWQERVRAIAVALYSGNFYALKAATNMGLLWYLPSFISLVLLHGVIEAQGRTGKAMLMALLVALHGVLGPVAAGIQDYVPLGLLPALYVIPMCYLVVLCHRHLYLRLPVPAAVLLALGSFALVKWGQMHWRLPYELGAMEVPGFDAWPSMLVDDLEGVTGALLLFQLARLPLGKLLAAFGEVSLQVYLVHAFIGLAIAKVLMRTSLVAHPVAILAISLALTAAIALAVARVVMASPFKRYLFPRDVAELTGRTAAGSVKAARS
ncbi:hypothetical protein GJ700_32395 [Duganella sp. FT92W]|uniref:Acyltransferase family protein n=1 Tax=Pseudoduganella rivuli TaxID=2666085 RepID=A0A7X2IUL6_9BURK|nr:hypothetical protein [Pseudoduganella rivuli]MRV76421.1 hypothetical protein [Pseudoduganella rivuli]